MRLLYVHYPKRQTLSGKLSWSHYVELLSISDDAGRSFYEKQCLSDTWSVRELKRQRNASLFERIALTRDQMAFVDIMDANNRALCSGGAGTGKTLLAMELAKRWTCQNKRVVMPCGSRWLKRYLETRFTIPGLTVTHIDALEVDAQRAGVAQFDAMIVDEGQDIFHHSRLKQMDRFLKGGLKQGQWCIFHDTNNQSDILNMPDPKAIEFLENFHPVKIPLERTLELQALEKARK